MTGRQKATQPAPHSPHAEEAVLGAALLSDDAARVLVEYLEPEDFYRPAHGHIAEAIGNLHRRGAHIDPISVCNQLAEKGLLEACGGGAAIVSLQADAPSTSSAATHAAVVRDRAVRRRYMGAALELSLAAADLAVPAENLSGFAGQMAARCDSVDGEDEVVNVEQFIAQTDDVEMIVPGFLGRMDRAMLLARPGYGKSTMERQLAVQLAAGVHPFNRGQRFKPLKVLLLDVENPPYVVKQSLQKLVSMVDTRRQGSFTDDGYEWNPARLSVCVREEGIDVLRPAGARWFKAQVRAAEPDVLIYGPIYKIARGRPNDEDFAVSVCDFLNDIRTTYGTAMIVETHPPHPTDGGRTPVERPYGASAWERWPDLGFNLRRIPDDDNLWELHPWRPARVSRPDWQRQLMRGGDNRWPWVTAYGKDSEL